MYVQCTYKVINKCYIYSVMAKKERLEIRMDKETKELLDKLAKNNKRKMADYLRLLIEYASNNEIQF